MKRYKILFAILLCLVGVVSYAQQSNQFVFSVKENLAITNQFDFTLSFSGNTILNCSNPVIEIQTGVLEFLDPNNDFQIDKSRAGFVSIRNFILLNFDSGSSTAIGFSMKFPNGTTCEGAAQKVKATLCGKNAEVDVAVKVGSVQNRMGFSISQQSPLNTQDICFSNSLIKYNISVDNKINDNLYGYYIYNGKVVVKIPSRADKLYLFKKNTFVEIAFNNDPLKGEISWNLPQQFGSAEGYDLYVTFPCNSASSDIATHPTVKISGETRGCQTAPYTSDQVSVVNASGFTNQNCSTCQGSGNLLNLNIVKNFPCLTCPQASGSINYQLNIGPNNADSTGVFQVRLPKELQTKLKSITRTRAGSIQLYYENKWKNYNVFDNLSQVNVEKIRWVVDMKNPLVDNTCLGFNDVVMNELPIYHSMRVGDADNPFSPFLIEEALELVSTEHCGKNVSLANYVNDADDQKDNKFKNINSIGNIKPDQKLTYRIVVKNDGYEDIENFSITNLLDTKILYNGNLKYGYTSSSTALSSELSMVPDNGIVENFPVNGNRAVIKRPVIGETGTITINSSSNNSLGLPFLCQSKKYLILQFDVIVSSSVIETGFGKRDVNSEKVKALENTVQFNSEMGVIQANAIVNIDRIPLPRGNFQAKCNRDSNKNWISSKDVFENKIPIKAGEKVHYKMYYENKGTVPVELVDMVNTRPRPGDTFELNDFARESQIDIKYTGESQLLYTMVGQTVNAEVIYGTDLTIPQNGLSIFDTWDTTTVPFVNQATWMRVHFSPPAVLNPGDKLEFVYYATVEEGGVGKVGNNSYAYKAKYLDTDGDTKGNELTDGQTPAVTVESSETQCAEPPACENCASFDLTPGETYLVSAWVKEENENNPYAQYKNYGNSQIRISFSSKEDKDLPPIGTEIFTPTGNIIDGWQRIIGEFKVPKVADDFKLDLENNNTDERTTYFDDVRVIPSKGNMKSFVYDQKTQRLMAELDENNYGTYYEYDLEGGLIRIKKETEKGVFTIQETRSSNPKK